MGTHLLVTSIEIFIDYDCPYMENMAEFAFSRRLRFEYK